MFNHPIFTDGRTAGIVNYFVVSYVDFFNRQRTMKLTLLRQSAAFSRSGIEKDGSKHLVAMAASLSI